MSVLIAVLMILHGLISAAFSLGNFSTMAPVPNPDWLSTWPRMGQSWLLTWAGLERSPLNILGGLLYLLGGAAFITAGMGLLSFAVPQSWWPTLALAGAVLTLAALLLYFHPYYVVGIAISLAVLVSILWLHWPSFMRLSV